MGRSVPALLLLLFIALIAIPGAVAEVDVGDCVRPIHAPDTSGTLSVTVLLVVSSVLSLIHLAPQEEG